MMFFEALWNGFPQENSMTQRRLSYDDMTLLPKRLPQREARLLNWLDMHFTFYCPFPGAVLAVIDAVAEHRADCGAATPEGYAALTDLLDGIGKPIT